MSDFRYYPGEPKEYTFDQIIDRLNNETVTYDPVTKQIEDQAAIDAVNRAYRPTLYTETLNGIPDVSASSAAANAAAMNEILSDLASTGGRIVIKNGAHFRQGFTTNAPIMLGGNGWSEKVTFHPDTPQDVFFEWVSNRSTGVNSELSLEGCGAQNLWVQSNRASRADCFRMEGVDHGLMHNVTVYGFKGSSWECQRVREFIVDGFITRYCAYADPANPANHRANVILASSAGVGDLSNLNHWNGVQFVFSLGPELLIDNAYKDSFDQFLIHALPRANTSYEDIVIAQYGGQRGWDAAGVARNEYAALHVGGASVASVANRMWNRSGAACTPITIRGSNSRGTKFGQGAIIGHGGTNLIHADGINNTVDIGLTDINSAGMAVVTCTAVNGSDTFTATSFVGGAIGTLPETGTVVWMQAGSPSPVPIVNGRKVYLIRLTDSTFKLANTRADALAGVGIVVTAATPGSTTPIQFYMGGELMYATGGAVINLSQLATTDDARVVAASDEMSLITRHTVVPYQGAFTSGPQTPQNTGEVKLFEGRNVAMNSTSDQGLLKCFAGHNFHVTKVVVRRVSGGSATNNAVGGIYTAAAKGGTTVLSASTAYSTLTASDTLAQFDPAATGRLASSTMYFSLTTASGADMWCDVHVYGRVID